MQDIWPEILKKQAESFQENDYYKSLKKDEKYLMRFRWETRQQNRQNALHEKEKKMLGKIRNGQRNVINLAYRKQRDHLQNNSKILKTFLKNERKQFEFFTKNQKKTLIFLKKNKIQNNNKYNKQVKKILQIIGKAQKRQLLVMKKEKKIVVPNQKMHEFLQNVEKKQKDDVLKWSRNNKHLYDTNTVSKVYQINFLQNLKDAKRKRLLLKPLAFHEYLLNEMTHKNKNLGKQYLDYMIRCGKNGCRTPKQFALQYRIQDRDNIKPSPSKRGYGNIYFKNRKNNDVVFKMRCYMGSAFRGYLKRNYLKNKGALTIPSLGYSAEQLVKRLESTFQPGMNWKNFGKKWHVDHIIPCNFFKINKTDHFFVKICWGLNNLRALNKSENIRKSDMMPDGSSVRDIKSKEQYMNMLQIVKSILGFKLSKQQDEMAENDFFSILESKQALKEQNATRNPLKKGL